ncbi:MAG: hypothetical protein O2856_19280 [Planctomycetota bacterium]|nr:hypothetical protein [Planctomycetota bacterium]
MNKTLIFALSVLVFASSNLWAEHAIRLRVSATIPPRPCEFPNRCDPVPAAAQSKVIVDNGVIRYVGSPPAVTQNGDLLTVRF